MSRSAEGLNKALVEIPKLKQEFWSTLSIPKNDRSFNEELQKTLRLEDFIDLGELMARDALMRDESCGAHFREEWQTETKKTKLFEGMMSFPMRLCGSTKKIHPVFCTKKI